MGKCPKCGKELGFRDKSKSFQMTSYINAIENGLFPEYNGKQVCISCQQSLLNSKGIEYRGLLAIKRGNERIRELANQLTQEKMNSKKNLKLCENCQHYRYDVNSQTIDTGIFTPNIKTFTFESRYCAKFEFSLKDDGKEAEKCTSYITEEDYQKKCLSGEMDKDKQRVQIVLDFSSLKEVMSKGGLVMSTYKCPNCNGMVDIPEAGKLLVCKYCNTPIKPVDIFEKIKSLIQSEATVAEKPKEIVSKPEKQEDDLKPDWYKEALKQHNQ